MRIRGDIKKRAAYALSFAIVLGAVFDQPFSEGVAAAFESNTPDKSLTVESGTIQVDKPDEALRVINVSGMVTDESGAAAPDCTVTLEKQLLYHDDGLTKEKWYAYDTTQTDGEGRYSIKAEKNTVYRISIGTDMPAHSETCWVRDDDITINLSASLYSFEGRVQTETGEGVSGVYITLERVGDLLTEEEITEQDESSDRLSGNSFPYGEQSYDERSDEEQSDEENSLLTPWDPVSEGADDELMLSVKSAEDGSFLYNEISAGRYRLYMGRTGVFVSEHYVDKDDFATVVITEDQATMEEYRNLILSDGERTDDYGTELDLPGYLLPTPTPTPKPQQTISPNYSGKRLYDGKLEYTQYAYSLSEYATKQYNSVPRVSVRKYETLLDPDKDTTKGMKFLRIDEYRKVNEKEFTKLYQSMIESYCKSAGISVKKSSLYGHAKDILDAAKEYEIDPVFLTTQTFHESAFGTSHLASGSTIEQVALVGYPRTPSGKFLTKKLKKPAKVYNLYGIKAYDADPYVGGTSFAYYNGWTTPKKAIFGAAQYIHDNYVHNKAYAQNTAFKIRFINATGIWHQYATGPTYAEDIGRRMISMASVYSARAKFTYDLPVYKAETKKPVAVINGVQNKGK